MTNTIILDGIDETYFTSPAWKYGHVSADHATNVNAQLYFLGEALELDLVMDGLVINHEEFSLYTEDRIDVSKLIRLMATTIEFEGRSYRLRYLSPEAEMNYDYETGDATSASGTIKLRFMT